MDWDYIRLDVETSSGEKKSDVHMHVFPKKEVLERQQKPGGIPLNVALIMFDSTSAANFRRKMPNSLEYLTKNLNSLLMQGEIFYCYLMIFTTSLQNWSDVGKGRFTPAFVARFLCIGNRMGPSRIKDLYHACFQKLQKLLRVNFPQR